MSSKTHRLASGLLLKWFARAGRRQLQALGLLQTAKVYNRTALVWSPGKQRVVVLAPHMDDEVIGCGGTLARHAEQGADITVVFLTDGRQGGVVDDSQRSDSTHDIVAIRKEEARCALQELGINQLEFLDAPDGSLMQSAVRFADRLKSMLGRIQPELLYLPCFLEEHPDHRAASELLLHAVRDSGLAFDCRGYEVWTPLVPNCLVNIDETVERKRRSLSHYRSQLAQADYRHSALGLSAYRSSAFAGGTCRFAEAFYALPVGEYLQLYQAYRRGH